MSEQFGSGAFNGLQRAGLLGNSVAGFARAKDTLVQGVVRPLRDLPFFCDPIKIFLLNWGLMLLSLSFQITYTTYPTMLVPIETFAISLVSLILGYSVAGAILKRRPSAPERLAYVLNVTRLWHINALLCFACMGIILLNWKLSGPPPALGDPSSYLTYGRLKQILFPFLIIITVNAFLDSSKLRRVFFAGFGFFWLLIYITRGIVLVTLLQMLFAFAFRTSISKRKLYSIAFAGLLFAASAATLIGNARTAQDVFLEFLQIRPKYFDWPMVYLWLISYVSIPISNLCWMLDKLPFHGPTFSFLYPLLPSFWVPPDPHISIHSDPRIIDGASSYLAWYVLDFSYFGVFLANLCLGFVCAWLRLRGGPRKMLVSAIFLTALSFIFFTDMFLPLSTMIQVLVQSFVQRKCFQWEDAPAIEGAGA